MKYIDDILNRVTMYRLTLYYLSVLLCAGVLFSLLGILPHNPADMLFTAVVLIASCWAVNILFAKAYAAATSVESVYITAFILALIIPPVSPTNYAGIMFLVFVGIWAMSSKYILAIGKKHIFNPAALAAALGVIVLHQPVTWWVGGNLALLPFVLIGGLLVVRKLRRFDLVLSFAVVALGTIMLLARGEPGDAAVKMLQHSPFFFLAFVMLTEPLTTPPSRMWRIAYGALVGFLFVPTIHIGSFYLTPEIALLVGNIFSFAVSPKGRLVLTLKKIEKAAEGVFDFIFTPDRHMPFAPGQYLEWTLGHAEPDSRGNRRYFTIASSPAEGHVRLGAKFYEQPSSFKSALASLKPGDTISATQLAGDFTLPKDPKQKLVFIAGGIGVTPFRSMVQHLLDIGEHRDAVLLYANRSPKDIAYKEVFGRAQQEMGMRTIHAVNTDAEPGMHAGFIDEELIAKEIPDFRERLFYISGPQGMVDSFKKILRTMGVSRRNIKTDFFPGLV